jgi:hypothetical protein
VNLLTWNCLQIQEALSEQNRYYFWQHYRREPYSDHELVMYYAEHGAKKFAQKHRGELDIGGNHDS